MRLWGLCLVDGMSLGNTTRADVETLYGEELEPSGMHGRWRIDETGASVVSQLRIREDGVYMYYFFDEDDVLVGLTQSLGYLDGMD